MSDSVQQEPIQDESMSPIAEKLVVELPGKRLRERREGNHLSREEVAHHLRLDEQLIKALEDDDYTRLPSPAYICGYLRSYARLLKLPEDQIVQAYSRGEQIQSALIPESVSILPKKAVLNFAIVKTIVMIIVIILIAGILYLLVDKFDLFNSELRSQQRSALKIPMPPQSVPQSAKDATTAPVEEVQPITKNAQVGQTVAPVPAKVENSQPIIEQLPTPKTKIPEMPSETADTPVTPAKTQPSRTTTATPAQEQKDTSPAPQTQTLRMHFREDSWAEVTDNTGKRLIYQLVEKNADLNLDGEPPFTILLGNAPEVQVFFKGQEFDHAKYHRGEIAYFRVGVK
jgi:cytoskeleton protein RodZ